MSWGWALVSGFPVKMKAGLRLCWGAREPSCCVLVYLVLNLHVDNGL